MFIVWRGVRPSIARSQTLSVRKSRERMYRPSREKRISQTEEMISLKKDFEVGSSSTSNSKPSANVLGLGLLRFAWRSQRADSRISASLIVPLLEL